jgi:hypothetical protein
VVVSLKAGFLGPRPPLRRPISQMSGHQINCHGSCARLLPERRLFRVPHCPVKRRGPPPPRVYAVLAGTPRRPLPAVAVHPDKQVTAHRACWLGVRAIKNGFAVPFPDYGHPANCRQTVQSCNSGATGTKKVTIRRRSHSAYFRASRFSSIVGPSFYISIRSVRVSISKSVNAMTPSSVSPYPPAIP